MPPLLALFLCIVFVYYLLRQGSKQSYGSTRALWIPTLWILSIASRPMGRWFLSSGGNPDSSPLDRIFLIGLLIMATSILLRRKFHWYAAMRENKWLIILVGFMLVSILWSQLPNTSFVRWIREMIAVLMAFVVISEPSPRKAVEIILRRMSYILIPFSMVLIKYFPQYGIGYGEWSGEKMWIGVAQQKNGLGRLCIITAIFLLWSIIRRWQGKNTADWKYQNHSEIFLLAMTFLLLGGPKGKLFYSATAVYALGIGLFIYLGLHLVHKFKINLKVGVLWTAVSVIIFFGVCSVFFIGSNLESFAAMAGRNETLTGRTVLWAQLLPVAKQNLFFGGGFASFWTSRTRILFDISDGHNGYLDMILGLGLVGILLIYLFLLSSCLKARNELSLNFDWGTLWICYIIMMVVHNIGESSIDTLTSPMTAIFLLFTVSTTSLSRENGSNHSG